VRKAWAVQVEEERVRKAWAVRAEEQELTA
jgi:hypothetical protein